MTEVNIDNPQEMLEVANRLVLPEIPNGRRDGHIPQDVLKLLI